MGLDKLRKDIEEVPFFSFSIHDYARVLRAYSGVELTDAPNGQQELRIKHKPCLALTKGKGIKGDYYCSDMLRSVFLPGDKYFLFNARYCGNYNGQLLIDTYSGQYERLPKLWSTVRSTPTRTHSTASPAAEFSSGNRVNPHE